LLLFDGGDNHQSLMTIGHLIFIVQATLNNQAWRTFISNPVGAHIYVFTSSYLCQSRAIDVLTMHYRNLRVRSSDRT
jgi:hypothetical protein